VIVGMFLDTVFPYLEFPDEKKTIGFK